MGLVGTSQVQRTNPQALVRVAAVHAPTLRNSLPEVGPLVIGFVLPRFGGQSPNYPFGKAVGSNNRMNAGRLRHHRLFYRVLCNGRGRPCNRDGCGRSQSRFGRVHPRLCNSAPDMPLLASLRLQCKF